MKRVLPIVLLASTAFAQNPCKTHFTVIWKDHLNNITQGLAKDNSGEGLSPKNAHHFLSKLAKKYPDVCYAEPGPAVPVVFVVIAKSATYHGTRTVTHSAPVSGEVHDTTPGSDTYGQTVGTVEGTTESSSTIPYSLDYSLLTLTIEKRTPGAAPTVLRRFEKKALCRTTYGVAIKCHPRSDLLEEAVRWIHNGGLENPLQSVVE